MADVNLLNSLKQLSKLKVKKDTLAARYDELARKRAGAESEARKARINKINNYAKTLNNQMDDLVPEINIIAKTPIPFSKYFNKIGILTPISALFFPAVIMLFFLQQAGSIQLSIGASAVIGFLLVPSSIFFLIKWWTTYNDIDEYYEWKKEHKDWLQAVKEGEYSKEQLTEKFLAFERAYKESEALLNNMAKSTRAQIDEEINNIRREYQKLITPVLNEHNATVDEINGMKLLSREAFPHIDAIIRILENGRAQDLSNAINLAIDDDRKMREKREREEYMRRQEDLKRRKEEDEKRERQRREAERDRLLQEAIREQSETNRRLEEELRRLRHY